MEHSFSVEMKSKLYVKTISISDESHDRVLFEGNLGELVESSLVEDDVLEIKGSNGILRLGLTLNQLREIIKKAELVMSGRQDGAHNKYQEKKEEKE
jgi:hypothetical protein